MLKTKQRRFNKKPDTLTSLIRWMKAVSETIPHDINKIDEVKPVITFI
jgi:hypothetical protein